jgi:hypothetical protein
MGLTFLAPWVFVAAALAAAGVVALHLLAVGPPPEAPLPTARFVPARRARAMRRASRPADVALLALRVIALLLAGAAFARPTRVDARRAVARVIVVDQSRAVADPAAALDSALAAAEEGDLLIAFDDAARSAVRFGPRTADSLRTAVGARAAGSVAAAARAPGSLSVALAAALRAAPALRSAADSLQLVIVSPVVREELDAATPRLRALWTGGARVVRVPSPSVADSAPLRVAVRTGVADDALLAAASLAGLAGDDAGVRVVRDGADAADLAWARDGSVLVDWPTDGAPAAWAARVPVDTVGAVMGADDAPFVASMARRAVPPNDSGRAVAWWVDGAPAAIERAEGAGCVRRVGIEVPQMGDATLGPHFARLLGALAAPCGGARDLARPAAVESWLRGPPSLRPVSTVAELAASRSLLPAWLLAVALTLLLVEPLLRRARRQEVDA